ncbi:hypothetical protein [Aerosakkonema funiforme]|uniref:hypothetical protein n=1 Tax=Aerosakkonema funiforme TaxID=1246630 RepID=UPI0035B8FEED
MDDLSIFNVLEGKGEERGLQPGVMTERRATIENLLRVRFGALDEQLSHKGWPI